MRVGEKRTSASAGAPKTTGGKIKSNPPVAALSTRRGFPHSGLFAAGAQSQREGFGLFQPFQLFAEGRLQAQQQRAHFCAFKHARLPARVGV